MLGGFATLVAARGLALLDESRSLKAELLSIGSAATAAGLDIDRPTLQSLEARVVAASDRMDRLAATMESDPTVALLAALPLSGDQVRAGRRLVNAGRQLLSAGKDGLLIVDRYVAIREAQTTDPAGRSAMAALVGLMATSQDLVDRIDAEIGVARATLAALPPGLFGPLADARDLMIAKADQFGPLVHSYAEIDGIVPAILGWGGQKRYLVLAEDPAELRPSGGFIGTYGIVTFKDGRLVERHFHDVFSLDVDRTYPYVKPPVALDGHLLGGQSWQLADANWSPDFPTAAQDALRLYTNESGDGAIDGVIALSTYAIDDLLKTTGPISVPAYGVTVAAGETTLTSLQQTRTSRVHGANRKAFLDAFAGQLVDAVLGLPPHAWTSMVDTLQAMGRGRRALVWLRDPAAQALVVQFGWDGAVRQDAGDYLFAVDANVSPASKLNAVTERRQTLDVTLNARGTASHQLRLLWTNRILALENAPYRALPEQGGARLLGNYVRVLTTAGSQIRSVSGGTLVHLTGPEEVGRDAGRAVFGNYVAIPPGPTSVTYSWVSDGVVAGDGKDFIYRLTVQKQPGTRDDRIAITVHLPAAARVLEATGGLTVSGQTATLVTTLASDLQMEIRFRNSGP